MPPTDIQMEQETTIALNAAEDHALVWSTDPTFQRKMEKLKIEPHKTVRRGERGLSAWYRVPKSWVKVKPPATRVLTEELRQRLAAMGQTRAAARLAAKTP